MRCGACSYVVDLPAFGKDLGCKGAVKLLAVKVLDLNVVPRATRIDEDGPGAVETAPIVDGVIDEFGFFLE